MELPFKFWYITEQRFLNNDDIYLKTSNNIYVLFGTPEKIKPLQYTGIKDKNGVEIYEGDIVIFDEQEGKMLEIKYKENVASFVMRNNKFCWHFSSLDYKELEVAGNIYQNPELLEQDF